MDRSLEDLLERAGQIERRAAADQGEFTFFGLFEDPENPDRWDLVVAGPWMEALRPAQAIAALAGHVTGNLPTPQAVLIGRIVPVRMDADFVRDMTRRFPTRGSVREVGPGIYGGVEIRRGYLLTAEPPARSEALAA